MKTIILFMSGIFLLAACIGSNNNSDSKIGQAKINKKMITFENSVELQQKLAKQYEIGGLMSVSDYVNNYLVVGSTLQFTKNTSEAINFEIYDRKVELIDKNGAVNSNPILPLMAKMDYHKKIYSVKVNDVREPFQLVLFY